MGFDLHRRRFLSGLGSTTASLALGLRAPRARGRSRPPNVLFIIIDDLNDWVGVLRGNSQAKTPNINRLARSGLLFTNAHCAAPLCNASRASLLTGLRPSTTGVYTNHQPLRLAVPDVVTLPQHLRESGYRTFGCGKIFHYGDPQSWDEGSTECGRGRPPHGQGTVPRTRPASGLSGVGNIDWGPVDVDDTEMSDARVADQVSAWLAREHDRPFFIGCGFVRPHLPWYVPRQYFDLYDEDEIVTPVAPPDDLDDVPAAGRRMAQVASHQRITQSGNWRAAVHGYLAAVSFADAQIGRVLDALDETGRAQDTLVVMTTDHGWSLGEKSHWTKSALWEECTRVPLILRAPGLDLQGRQCIRPVNLVDLFPTVTELCGVPAREGLDGVSLGPLVDDPRARWTRPSVTTMGPGNHAARDTRWRYIRYEDGSEELYDHAADPNEGTNLALDPGLAGVRRRLAAALPAHDAPHGLDGDDDCRVIADGG